MLTTTRYTVRAMTEADIFQVAAIEHESFSTTWPQTAYKRELSNRLARYLVLVDRSKQAPPTPAPTKKRGLLDIFRRGEETPQTSDYIVGYVGVWLLVDEAHIVAIAVREPYRRQGLGELLLAESIELALENQQETITLEVRRSNESALALYDKYKFLKVGVRRRYYSDNHEDAIVMSTPPIRHPSYKEHQDYLKQAWERRWASGS